MTTLRQTTGDSNPPPLGRRAFMVQCTTTLVTTPTFLSTALMLARREPMTSVWLRRARSKSVGGMADGFRSKPTPRNSRTSGGESAYHLKISKQGIGPAVFLGAGANGSRGSGMRSAAFRGGAKGLMGSRSPPRYGLMSPQSVAMSSNVTALVT